MRRFRLPVITLSLLLASALLAPPADALEPLKEKTFWFGTHAARTNVAFISEADLETIHGTTHEMNGSIAVGKEGKVATGKLTIPVSSLKTGIDLRDKHLRSDAWLHAKKFPWIVLTLTEAKESKDNPKIWEYTGTITIKGVTKPLKAKARIRAIPESVGKQLGSGSWVRVKTGFDVKITDFGVKIPQHVTAKVSQVWRVNVDIYGTTSKPRPKKKKP